MSFLHEQLPSLSQVLKSGEKHVKNKKMKIEKRGSQPSAPDSSLQNDGEAAHSNDHPASLHPENGHGMYIHRMDINH